MVGRAQRPEVGQVITAAKLTNLDTMLISTGTITGNADPQQIIEALTAERYPASLKAD